MSCVYFVERSEERSEIVVVIGEKLVFEFILVKFYGEFFKVFLGFIEFWSDGFGEGVIVVKLSEVGNL